MSKLPDFEAWAVFAKVAETGSFARAAEELGLSKPTVSKALARLETRLGSALFHRTSRRLSLSESGRASLERASRILSEGELVEAEACDQSSIPRGTVRMAAPMSFGIKHLGPALAKFMQAYPEVVLDVSLSDQRADLVTEGFDLALRIGALQDSSLLARRLCAVRVLLVGSPAYFARHGRPVHPRDLADHHGFHYANIPDGWKFSHPVEGEFSIAVPSRLRSNNSDVLQDALLAGEGIALQPEFQTWREVADGRLISVLEDWLPQRSALHVVTPPSSLRPQRVQVLIDFLTAHFVHPPWSSECETVLEAWRAANQSDSSAARLASR
jgi:DNA-binding transcriptional LysR family regulator